MDRNKRPALTSPWKIGFLVSLLLVAVSAGVSFLITRTFGVEWTWLQTSNGAWAFDKTRFLNEMLPLVVLVPLVSLFAYFIITGAVRKYRAYLDSGLDYKNFVQSLHKIGDLQDERLKKLSGYPELRDFLAKLRDRIGDREKAIADKEASLAAKQSQVASGEELIAETGILIDAIVKGPQEGFGEDLAISVPALKQIDRAIRDHLLSAVAGSSLAGADANEHLANVREEIRTSTSELTKLLDEVVAEYKAGVGGAREIEGQLNLIKDTVAAGPALGIAGQGRSLADLAARLEMVSGSLKALGEETKGVAINSALQAGSGKAGITEMIQLADDVRDVAAKFNGIAQQYERIGAEVRTTMSQEEPSPEDPEVKESIDAVTVQTSLWVERAMVLHDKFIALQEKQAEAASIVETKLGGTAQDQSYGSVEDLTEEPTDPVVKLPEASGGPSHDDFFERQAQTPVLDADAPQPEDVPGLQKEAGLFEEISAGADEAPDDDFFADIPEDEPKEPRVEKEAVAKSAEPQAPAGPTPVAAGPAEDAPLAAPPEPHRAGTGDFVQSHVDLSNVEIESHRATRAADSERVAAGASIEIESHRMDTGKKAKRATAEPSTPQPEEDGELIIDLYELGAVDYQPDGVHHNV